MLERAKNMNYPATVRTEANAVTVEAIKTFGCKQIAEFGVLDGETSLAILRHLDNRGVLHLFDFAHNVEAVVMRARDEGFSNVYGHGNSTKTR